VLDQFNGSQRNSQPLSYEEEERLAIQNENLPPANAMSESPKSAAQMLLKRSVSPDGRIDSLSVEFSCSVEHATEREIKAKALNTLKIQSEIVRSFLNGDVHKAGATSDASNGSVPARMLGIAGINTKWGRRLFINV